MTVTLELIAFVKQPIEWMMHYRITGSSLRTAGVICPSEVQNIYTPEDIEIMFHKSLHAQVNALVHRLDVRKVDTHIYLFSWQPKVISGELQ